MLIHPSRPLPHLDDWHWLGASHQATLLPAGPPRILMICPGWMHPQGRRKKTRKNKENTENQEQLRKKGLDTPIRGEGPFESL